MNLRILIGVQTDERTIATAFKQYRARESSLAPNFNKVDSEAFSGSAYKGDSYVSTADANGTVGFEVTRETLEDLLPAAGYVLTGTPTMIRPGFTFTDEAVATPSGKIEKFYTIIEQNLEDDEERIIIGAQFSNVDIDVTKSQYVLMNCDVLGYTVDYKDAITHTTFTTISDFNNPVTCVTSNLVLNSNEVSLDTQSAVLSINNNLENRFGLSTRDATRRVRNGFIEATLTVTASAYLKPQFKEAWEAMMDGSSLPSIILLQDGYDSGDNVCAIFVHNMKVNSPEMTDKNASGGLNIEYDVLNDITKNTPMSFAFGTID